MAERVVYEVWCQAHIDHMAESLGRPQPRYETTVKREAERLRRQADRECAAESSHFISTRWGRDVG